MEYGPEESDRKGQSPGFEALTLRAHLAPSMTHDAESDPIPPEELARLLGSRRVRERLLHLRHYRDEPPGEGIRLGLELSAAAIQSRDEASPEGTKKLEEGDEQNDQPQGRADEADEGA